MALSPHPAILALDRATLTPLRLALREPLQTAHGAITAREGVLVRLEGRGHRGFGCAMPLSAFGGEAVAETARALECLVRELVGGAAADLDHWLQRALELVPEAPAARASFDAALCDLAARVEGLRLADWLARRLGRSGRPRESVPVNAVLSGCDPGAVEASARAAVAAGFGTLKLKVGTEDDDARVASARRGAGAGVRLRLDANGAWRDLAEAHAALARLAAHDLELVEQPLPAGTDPATAARLRARSPVPIAADEGASTVEAARRVIGAGAVDLIVLKPGVVGLHQAGALAARAARHAVEVFVTSALDSAVGVAAALHLAAVAPGMGSERACGLATGALLADDLAALVPQAGRLGLPVGPGLGVVPDPAVLERCRTGPSVRVEP